jgi:hypothetical protein
MTTPLIKPVERVVDGGLVITLTREGLYVRERGRRQSYGPVAYSLLLLQAARDHAEMVRSAKKRQQRRISRGRLSIGGLR